MTIPGNNLRDNTFMTPTEKTKDYIHPTPEKITELAEGMVPNVCVDIMNQATLNPLAFIVHADTPFLDFCGPIPGGLARTALYSEAVVVRLRSLLDRACKWEQDNTESDAWNTSCGNAWLLTEGTPKDNDMKFCPYCGGNLVQADTADQN